MIRVVLADDHELIRVGFRAVLDAAADIEVVGEAANGVQAVAMAEALRPDIVLMDIQMPAMDGIEATRRIRAELADVQVVVLTTFELKDHVVQAVRAGASGFLGKGSDPGRLVDAVRAVAAGGSSLSSNAVLHLVEKVRDSADGPRPNLPALTTREGEVVELVAEGLSNQEIAERLVVSPLTVKTHLSRAMMKLEARDRAQLVAWFYRGVT